MKTHFRSLIVLGCMAICCSMSCSKIQPSTQFLSRFSLGETIKHLNVEDIDVSSVSAGGTLAAGNPSSHRRDFDVALTIKEPKVESFDEAKVFSKVEGTNYAGSSRVRRYSFW